MDVVKTRSPFVRSQVIERDHAITFLKSVGFAESEKAGVFTKEVIRSSAQKAAGSRVLYTVNIDDLLNVPKAWRQFVYRWSKRRVNTQPVPPADGK